MSFKVEQLTRFIESLRDNWDCDTGASGLHPSYCRTCEAKRLLNDVDMKALSDVLNAAEAVASNLQAGPDVLGNLRRAVAAFKKEGP